MLLEAGAEGRDYALELVVSGQVSRECGVQLDLIDVLVDAGADPNCLDSALAHRENAAAARLLQRGARETLVASVCLGRPYDLTETTPEERQVAFSGAALHGRVDALRDLLTAGVNIDAFNPEGWHSHSTAMHSAVASGNVEAMRAAGRRRSRPHDRGHPVPRHPRRLGDLPKGDCPLYLKDAPTTRSQARSGRTRRRPMNIRADAVTGTFIGSVSSAPDCE